MEDIYLYLTLELIVYSFASFTNLGLHFFIVKLNVMTFFIVLHFKLKKTKNLKVYDKSQNIFFNL